MTPALNTLIDTRTNRPIDLAMQKLEVTGRVYPLGSFIQVIHRFKCLGTQPMEAIYVAALPTGGVLRRFKIIGENFTADSKLEPRKKARAEYEKGISEGHLSVLAETNQDGLTHLSVGQVQPDEEISVIMEVVVGVATKDRGFQFRYPFTLAPNYHSGARVCQTAGGVRMELPENVFGDMVLPEWKTAAFGLHEVSFDLQVYGGTNLTAVSSPSHRIAVAPQRDGSVRVSLAGMDGTPNRDLVLDVSVPEEEAMLFTDAGVFDKTTVKELPETATRWTLLIPSSHLKNDANMKRTPRKVVFLVDRSGSMSGQPIEQAKQTLLSCLSTLTAEDEFGIVHFGSDATAFHDSLAKADDTNRKKALAWIEKIPCSGGTEMLNALATATRVLGGQAGDVFLLTDGEVGHNGAIVEHMASAKCRVHVLGIGVASQHRFMSQLARRTGGVCDVVSPRDNVVLAGMKLFNQIKEPVLKNPKITVDGTDVLGIDTVWDGVPLLIEDPVGKGDLPFTALVDGVAFHAEDSVVVTVPTGLIALLGAGRKLEDLSSKMDLAGVGTPKHVQVEQEMEQISTAYGLASRVMSLVAVVHRIGDQAGVTPEQKLVAVGIPEGKEDLSRGFATSHMYSAPGVYTGVTLNTGMPINVTRGRSKGGSHDDLVMDLSRDVSYSCSSVNVLSTADAMAKRPELYDTYNKGPLNMYSPELSTEFLDLPVACAGPAGATAPAYDPEAWDYTGNLLVDVACLRSDGGLPGYGIEFRVRNTLVLALIVAKEAAQTPGVYEQHLGRMLTFLQAESKPFGEAVVFAKVFKVIRTGVCQIDRAVLEGYFWKFQKEYFDLQSLLSELRATL